MTKLIHKDKTRLKDCAEIKESAIQAYIYEHPEALGLGNVTCKERERNQVSGGRLDILFTDEDSKMRYEVEIQLGKTDPSHIIRTIEYWDLERKKKPEYEHCAVIVAEEITGRFMNVISLFNGAIPLIALQMSAYKMNDDEMILTFTRILDKVVLETDEEPTEVVDRNYWNKLTPKMMPIVDELFKYFQSFIPKFELKYNKNYIGMVKDGVSNNFIDFEPRKNFVYLAIKGEYQQSFIDKAEDAGLSISYNARYSNYYIQIYSIKDYLNNKELIDEQIKKAMEFRSIDYD